MGRPPKYTSEAERRQAQLEQKRRSATKGRRKARSLDPLAPYAGAASTGAKLNAAQVAEIRCLHREQQYTLATLARQFDVSERTISAIARGETWQYEN